MFDKTFFKFALGFSAIIVASLGLLYVADYIKGAQSTEQTASVR